MHRGELVLLGRITDAHGLKGEVKIASYTARPEDIAAYGPLITADKVRRFEIASLRPGSRGVVIAQLSGVADRTAAEKLKGTELYVAREVLPAPDEDEFYHSDLIGLLAHSPSGETIGEVVAVHNFGAGDLLEIRVSGSSRTELIPFDAANVPKIDLQEGYVAVVLPSPESAEHGSDVNQ